MSINKVLVIGAGQMGAGIAQVAAEAGCQVFLKDIRQEFVGKGLTSIDQRLLKKVAKGAISESEHQVILSRITGATDWEQVADVDIAIEAVTENMTVKREVFQTLDKLCPNRTIFATNTSSLPVTFVGTATERAHKVIGMHFFNPVPVMNLIEIICGLATSEDTYEKVRNFAVRLGKTPVRIADYPGFAGNRIVIPMINEAIFSVMEGVASAEDIDNVLKLGFNHPMGPLALADLIGLDTVLSIMEVLHDGYGDDKYRPCPLLRKMVQAGYLGRKTGRGFYEYK